MGKRKVVKQTVVPVPKSVEKVAEFVRQIGEHDRALEQIQADLNNKIERIKALALEKSQPHQKEIEKLFEGVLIFAQANRGEITEGEKKKTVHLPTGDILWRKSPPAVSLSNVDAVIALCKKRGLKRFIRVKEEVDKEAMLKEQKTAERIDGVTIEQREEFVVRPSEVKVEFSRDTAKKRKLRKTTTKK